jgi:hypothetical protein
VNSWWSLGEGVGQSGGELALYQIACAFCSERGNWRHTHREQKSKPNGRKVLYFDTYQCGNCAGFVMVLWSPSESGGMHGYKVLPWPLRLEKYPEHWPEAVGRYWLQAKRSIKEENWDAAAVMARSSMQAALRQHGAQGKTLKAEVDDLADRGILPPLMKEWSHELRELGNESAHPDPSQTATAAEDARDIVSFLDFLLDYLYNLPDQIQKYRQRKK